VEDPCPGPKKNVKWQEEWHEDKNSHHPEPETDHPALPRIYINKYCTWQLNKNHKAQNLRQYQISYFSSNNQGQNFKVYSIQ